MKGIYKIITIAIVFSCMFIILSGNDVFAQQSPEEMINSSSSSYEESFNSSEVTVINVPVNPTITRMESMTSETELREALSGSFENLSVAGAQEIIDIYLQNGYGLSDIAEILKNAGFTLEDVFTAMVNNLGQEGLQDIVASMLGAGFEADDVFKTGINYLKDIDPTITDEEIVLALLGEQVDAETLKGLMQEIFIKKMEGVGDRIKADLVNAMIDAGFSMGEITNALIDNGFSVDEIANIYCLAGIDVGLAYDLLINAGEGQSIQDVVNALMNCSYGKNEALQCIFNKLESTHTLEQIFSLVIGEIGEDGPTTGQINNAIMLAGIMQENGKNLSDICNALMANGLDLTNTAAVCNALGIGLEEAFTTLLGAQGGQNAAEVALALIANGYDVHTVFGLAVTELKNQGFNASEIVNMLFQEIDPDSGATKQEIDYATLLVDVLLSEGYSLQEIATAFVEKDFSLENITDLFMANDIGLEDTYTALKNSTSQDIAGVAIAMINSGYDINTVLGLAVADLKGLGKSTGEIVTMIVGVVEEGKRPTSEQMERAQALTELLILQGDSLQDIADAIFDCGFSLEKMGSIFKKAEISTADAFNALLNVGGGQLYAEVCLAMNKNYNGAEIFEIAVAELRDQGYTLLEIFEIIIGQIDTEEGMSLDQISNATDLVKFLLADGATLDEIYNTFLEMNASLNDIARVSKRASVDLEDAFNALLNAGNGQDIVDVCRELMNVGYSDKTVLELGVSKLKEQGLNTESIINLFMGTVDAEKGPTNQQQREARYLMQVLSADGSSLAEICEGLSKAGFDLADIASVCKKAGIGLLETYNTLVSINGGQDIVTVINKLNEAGYNIATIFNTVVSDLKAQGYDIETIVTMLIGEIDPENGPSEEQLKRAQILGVSLEGQAYSLEDICNAFLKAGFDLEDSAVILKAMNKSFEEAYEVLLNAGEGQDVVAVGLAMIKAGYDAQTVLETVTSVLEEQGLSMPDIIGALIGEIAPGEDPSELQMLIAQKLTEIFKTQEYSLSEICNELYNAGFNLNSVALLLKKSQVEFDEAYAIMCNLGGTQNIADVAVALIEGGYNSKTVLEAVVSILIDQGYNIADIVTMFIGTVDPEKGPTAKQINYAAYLVSEFQNAEKTLEEICAVFQTSGFGLEDMAAVLKSAEVEAQDAFNVLLNFGGSQDAVDLAFLLIDQGFNAADTFTALVSFLSPTHEIIEIIEMVIGTIDAEEGLSDDQISYARDLTKAFQNNGVSLADIAGEFFSYGFNLDNIAKVFKLAEITMEETYGAIMEMYTPVGEEVKIRVVTAALISGGYNSFEVYSFAVDDLAGQGITEQADIISILIGNLDPENKQQVGNAAALVKVLNYNEDRFSAVNTVESFLDLFKKGYNIEQITNMLIENGFSAEAIKETFENGFNTLVKELAKAGKKPAEIVQLFITADNKEDYIRVLAEQLYRNDFSHTAVYSAFYGLPGGTHWSDLQLVAQGIIDAADYDIKLTEEADIVRSLLDAGNTLAEISQYFAEKGYQMSFVCKLLKSLDQSIGDIFAALEQTKDIYQANLLTNDTAAIITLLAYYGEKEVFQIAAAYYKDLGMSAEKIVLRLMAAELAMDENGVFGNALIGEYYKGVADLQTESFITLFKAGYSISWIKDALLEKGYTIDEIESFIQEGENFAAIYQGLRDDGMSAYSIVRFFEVKDSPSEYTVLLAENMVRDDIDESYVRSLLLYFGAESEFIEEGIQRAKQ